MNPQLELTQISWPSWVIVPTTPATNKKKYTADDTAVIPADKKAHDDRKIPKGKKWQQTTKTPDVFPEQAGGFLLCGALSGVIVIDVDDLRTDAAEEWMKYAEEHNPLTAKTLKGWHIFIEYSEEVEHRVNQKLGYDVRTDGGGVKLPGDPNEPYRSWHPETPVHNAKLGPIAPALKILAKWAKKGRGKNAKTTTGRSPLAELLANPPSEGGRNDWLAKVAGHYVKLLAFEDSFKLTLDLVNRTLDAPLEQSELDETVATQWERYKAGADEEAETAIDTNSVMQGAGNIAIGGKRFSWVHKDKDGDVLIPLFVSERQPWPVGTITDPERGAVWLVDVGDKEPVELPASYMADSRKFNAWCAKNRISTTLDGAVNTSFARELADVWQRMNVKFTKRHRHWGWFEGEWVGLGEAVGPEAYKIKLGHEREDLLVPTMKEMLLWQDAQPAALFCSWVAAQAVKGRVSFGFEPNMIVQGRAGAGKTRGLFGFGARLTGSPHQASATVPVIRDSLGWHRNGIVVLDDISNTKGIEELYRQSTQNNSITKKGGDNFGQTMEFPLYGSMLVTGEVLGAFGQDKALIDRSIILEIESMRGRVSPHDPERSQWEDIRGVFESLGGDSEETAYELAGSFVSALLGAVDEIEPPRGGDRAAGKEDMLRYGAALWDHVCVGEARCVGGRRIQDVIEEWILGESATEEWTQTSLMRQILPIALAGHEHGSFLSFIVQDGKPVLGIHPLKMSQWWTNRDRSDRAGEIGSKANIEREIALIQSSIGGENGVRTRLLEQSVRVRTIATEALLVALDSAQVELPSWVGDPVKVAIKKLRDS